MKKELLPVGHEPLHYRYRNFYVGLFVAVPLILIPLLFGVALVKSGIAEPWVTVYVRYESGEGLSRGSPVNMRGVRIGHVRSLELNDFGSVDVRMRIRQRYARFVSITSIARLQQKNFVVGDWEIDLAGDADGTRTVAHGDTLTGELPIKLDRTIQQVTMMVTTLETIFAQALAGKGVLGRLLADDSLVDDFSLLLARANDLAGKAEGTLARANSMIGSVAAFGDGGKAVADSFLTLAVSADSLLQSAGMVVHDLKGVTAQIGGLPSDMDTVMSTLKRDLDDAGVLLQSLRHHWFFRRAIQKAGQQR